VKINAGLRGGAALLAGAALCVACGSHAPSARPASPSPVTYHRPTGPGDAAVEYVDAELTHAESVEARFQCAGPSFGSLPVVFSTSSPMSPPAVRVSGISRVSSSRWRVSLGLEGTTLKHYVTAVVNRTGTHYEICRMF
jgi:hypothetical protein